jgi:hydroxylaminobenzene mutase
MTDTVAGAPGSGDAESSDVAGREFTDPASTRPDLPAWPKLTYDPGLSTAVGQAAPHREERHRSSATDPERSRPATSLDDDFELPPQTPGRHPLDPDLAPSSKSAAVLALGVAALITGPLIGGIVPATLALLLARQARSDLRAGAGYLVGGRQLRTGVRLAWVGLGLAVAALVAMSVLGILSLADLGTQDFPDTSN